MRVLNIFPVGWGFCTFSSSMKLLNISLCLFPVLPQVTWGFPVFPSGDDRFLNILQWGRGLDYLSNGDQVLGYPPVEFRFPSVVQWDIFSIFLNIQWDGVCRYFLVPWWSLKISHVYFQSSPRGHETFQSIPVDIIGFWTLSKGDEVWSIFPVEMRS